MTASQIMWPTACVSCGVTDCPLEAYTDVWQSSYTVSTGKRTSRTYSVATTIGAHLCERCKIESVRAARFDQMKYNIAIKSAGLLLIPFIVFVFFLNASIFSLQPGAENYPISYTIGTFISLSSPWIWMILGALSCLVLLLLARGFHATRIEKPYWNHMSLHQKETNVSFTFKSSDYREQFASGNPHLSSGVKENFKPRYIPRLSLLWIPIGFSLVGIIIAFQLTVSAWIGVISCFLIIYSLLWVRIFRVSLTNADRKVRGGLG